MGIHALTLRYLHPERDDFAGIDDSQLARYCFKSSTTVQPSEPSENELALQAKQLELAEFQLTELQRQSELQQEFAGQIEPFLELQAQEAEAALAERERLAPIQEELLNLALEDLRRGGAATPEQIELIEEAGSAALARGETDIERFRTESLEALREELAPGLGLRPSDTPILDRGARVSAEATRQGGQLSQGIRGAEATARLNFPLASSQLLQAGSLGLSRLSEAARQFQDRLRSSAIANRIGLFQSVGGLGLGLANAAQVPFPSFQRGSTTTSSDPFGTFSSILGGAGGLLTGLGAVGAFSSRRLKTDKAPVDEAAALEVVENLPVEAWRYKEGLGLNSEERHIGPYAEDLQTLGLSDGVTINPVDVAGLGLAAVKGLAKKVERLEHSLGLAEAASKAPANDDGRADGGQAGLGLAKAA